MKKLTSLMVSLAISGLANAGYADAIGQFGLSFGNAMMKRQEEIEQQQYQRNLAMQRDQREQELHNMQMRLYQQQLAQNDLVEQEYQSRLQAFLNKPENKIFINDFEANKAFNDAVEYVSKTDKSVKSLNEVFIKARKIALSVIQK